MSTRAAALVEHEDSFPRRLSCTAGKLRLVVGRRPQFLTTPQGCLSVRTDTAASDTHNERSRKARSEQRCLVQHNLGGRAPSFLKMLWVIKVSLFSV